MGGRRQPGGSLGGRCSVLANARIRSPDFFAERLCADSAVGRTGAPAEPSRREHCLSFRFYNGRAQIGTAVTTSGWHSRPSPEFPRSPVSATISCSPSRASCPGKNPEVACCFSSPLKSRASNLLVLRTNGYSDRVDIHGETRTQNDPSRRIPYGRAPIGCGGGFREVGVPVHCLCPSLRPGTRHTGRLPAHCLL